MSRYYKEYSKRVGTHKVNVKLVEEHMSGEGTHAEYLRWEPELLKLCSEHNIKTMFVSHKNREVDLDFKKDSVYVFCKPTKTIIGTMFTVDLEKNFNLNHDQYDRFIDTPSDVMNDGTYKEYSSIKFRNTKNPHEYMYVPFCYYMPTENVFILSDLYHEDHGQDILKYVSDMIKSGSYITVGSSIHPAVSNTVIHIADENDITKIVKENLKTTTDAMNAQLQDRIKNLNEFMKAEKRKHMTIPDFVTNDRHKIIKYTSRDGGVCLSIATKISFKLDRIFYDEDAYDVSSLSHKRTVWASVMLNDDSKVTGVRLYNAGFTDLFMPLHRTDSVFDGGMIICAGSYLDRISEITVDSVSAYDSVIEIVKEILSTVHSSDITGYSGDSAHEHFLLTQVREGELREHIIKSDGWKATKKDKKEKGFIGGARLRPMTTADILRGY